MDTFTKNMQTCYLVQAQVNCAFIKKKNQHIYYIYYCLNKLPQKCIVPIQ